MSSVNDDDDNEDDDNEDDDDYKQGDDDSYDVSDVERKQYVRQSPVNICTFS